MLLGLDLWRCAESDHREADYDQARAWALTRLGLLYHNALGVERDANAAAQWWRKAALLDDADGQAMLGAAHHLGAGVERDRVAALAWLTRTRAARSQFADRFYVAVRESCSPQERREAERQASLPLEAAEVQQ